MMIRKRPCIPSKATTTTSPGGGFLRDACNEAPFSIDGISPMRKLSPGDTSLQAFKLTVRVCYWWQVSLSELSVVPATTLMVEEVPLLTGIVPDAPLSTCAREPR